ncbi:hypothetical protein EDB85DRAFT_2286195 [Lactarius pseudohatsudake]|nr:hypothetical protein EDB85DRAFT_1106960 [Lactarius pseudohatsudake]KAH9041744.1 hypothetical protein EDB85DRAFT_2286195 [Lactarius pseudohatsudake]
MGADWQAVAQRTTLTLDKAEISISETATPAVVIDGFHHHRFVLSACTMEAPLEAEFELHGGERLPVTLLEIVRSHLPTAEFVFLSACHTAWAMVDEDGRDLAEHFYKALFSTSRREQGYRFTKYPRKPSGSR